MLARCFASLLALLAATLSPWSGADSRPAGCETLLLSDLDIARQASRVDVKRKLEQYRLSSYDLQSLVRVEPKLGEQKGQRYLRLDREHFAPLIRHEKWEFKNENFFLMNTGFRNLEAHSQKVHGLIWSHISKWPEYALEIRFGDRFHGEAANLRKWRWRMHSAVLKRYRHVKSYLDNADLFLLRWANETSHNNDGFAVFDSNQKLLSTIQISYHGDRNFFEPNLDGFFSLLNLGPSEQLDKLPFEYRLTEPAGITFRHSFYSYFEPSKVCEFTRYAKFDRMPFEVQNRLLYLALKTAQSRGMRAIIAGGDETTSRLFARYGFKRFGNLPTRSDSAEYLNFLILPSHEAQVLERSLGQSAEKVKVTAMDEL